MHIVLLCNQGMSTSLLVERMKEAAASLNQSATIEAHAVDAFDEQLKTADVILLGPQIRFKKNEFIPKAQEANVSIGVVDMTAYGTVDGKKVLQQALDLYEKESS